ncbi:MAG: hypothetical protein EBZ47_04460, partial [Chlamydiae bacterium]|nr:hypothetical protein [Chlamydiota bacterium]
PAGAWQYEPIDIKEEDLREIERLSGELKKNRFKGVRTFQDIMDQVVDLAQSLLLERSLKAPLEINPLLTDIEKSILSIQKYTNHKQTLFQQGHALQSLSSFISDIRIQKQYRTAAWVSFCVNDSRLVAACPLLASEVILSYQHVAKHAFIPSLIPLLQEDDLKMETLKELAIREIKLGNVNIAMNYVCIFTEQIVPNLHLDFTLKSIAKAAASHFFLEECKHILTLLNKNTDKDEIYTLLVKAYAEMGEYSLAASYFSRISFSVLQSKAAWHFSMEMIKKQSLPEVFSFIQLSIPSSKRFDFLRNCLKKAIQSADFRMGREIVKMSLCCSELEKDLMVKDFSIGLIENLFKQKKYERAVEVAEKFEAVRSELTPISFYRRILQRMQGPETTFRYDKHHPKSEFFYQVSHLFIQAHLEIFALKIMDAIPNDELKAVALAELAFSLFTIENLSSLSQVLFYVSHKSLNENICCMAKCHLALSFAKQGMLKEAQYIFGAIEPGRYKDRILAIFIKEAMQRDQIGFAEEAYQSITFKMDCHHLFFKIAKGRIKRTYHILEINDISSLSSQRALQELEQSSLTSLQSIVFDQMKQELERYYPMEKASGRQVFLYGSGQINGSVLQNMRLEVLKKTWVGFQIY